MTPCAPKCIDCWLEPHWRSTVVDGTDSGQPAASTALRPMLSDCSPTCMTQPMMTSSTISGSRPLRSWSALRVSAARAAGCQSLSLPLRFPPGVRMASTMTASVMIVSCCSLDRWGWKKLRWKKLRLPISWGHRSPMRPGMRLIADCRFCWRRDITQASAWRSSRPMPRRSSARSNASTSLIWDAISAPSAVIATSQTRRSAGFGVRSTSPRDSSWSMTEPIAARPMASRSASWVCVVAPNSAM